MEKKYENFLNYNWNESPEWRQYLNNLSDTPKSTRLILHFRKRFYKLKIDPDFDDKYTPESEVQSEFKHTCTSASKDKEPSFYLNAITAIECFVWLGFIFNYLVNNKMDSITLISMIIRILKKHGIKFNKEYINELVKDDNIHLLIYAEILIFTGRINHLLVFPLMITATLSICEYFATYLRIFNFLKKYFLKVVEQEMRIYGIRALSFIIIGIYSFIAMIISRSKSGVIFFVLYFCFLRAAYSISSTLKNSCRMLKYSINTWIGNGKIPGPIGFVLDHIIAAIEMIG